jgi:hypothetical protein
LEENNHRVSLKEFILRIMDEREKAFRAYIDAQRDAIALAKENIEHRLKQLNETRNEVMSDRGLFVKTDTYDANHKALVDKVESQAKLLYIGIGVVLVLEIVLRVAL